MEMHQTDCFKINMRFWKFLGIWPGQDPKRYYNYYSKVFIFSFVIVYILLCTINFYFLPRELEIFIEETIFYFTEISVASKALTFIFMRNGIIDLFIMLESEIFQPNDDEGKAIIKEAKKFIITYWKVVAAVSITSNITHIFSPLVKHLFTSVDLIFPVCSYSLFSEETRDNYKYLIYFYQSIGMHFHLLYNLNMDTFFLGLMIFVIAQLDILDAKLRRVTEHEKNESENGEPSTSNVKNRDSECIKKINQCVIHYGEVDRFCNQIQEVFSVTLFVQFSMASCIICVCLFRCTLGAPLEYYVFLCTYMFVMITQILVPCFFGTRIMDKSNLLSFATYNCDWTARSRQFKSNLRLFVERANKPLSITGGKMFSLSLNTFTSIMNSAYSFFTLLQHMQSRD